MQFVRLSFTRRVTLYFGTLFLLAIGTIFWIWYFGVGAIGIIGARDQRLTETMHILETSANLQRTLISKSIKNKRGDILVLAESQSLSRQLERRDPDIQANLELLFDRLQRAYPDHYQHVTIVDPLDEKIIASDIVADIGQVFHDTSLIKQAKQAGATEIIDHAFQKDVANKLAIIRQIFALDEDGYTTGKLVGILVAEIDLQQLVSDGLQEDMPEAGANKTSLLLDSEGKVLAKFPAADSAIDSVIGTMKLDAKTAMGFEGTFVRSNNRGEEFIVVYRHVPLSGGHAWTLLHYVDKDEALGELKGRVNILIAISLLMTVISLILISLASRSLTRPLISLSSAAKKLGGGDFSVRALTRSNDGQEVAALSTAFNWMAENIELSQHTLEEKIAARTKELQRSEARHRILFESTADAILVFDQHKIVDCNPAAVSLFGVNQREDLLAVGVNQLSPALQTDQEESRIAAARQYQAAMASGGVAFEWTYQRLDNGHIFTAEVLLSPVEIEGEILLHGAIRDISIRKISEEKVRLSEQNLAITLQSIGDAVISTDAGGCIVRMNTTAERLTGWTLKEAIGRPLSDVFHIINVDTREPLADPAQMVMGSGEIVALANHSALLSRDGSEYQVADSAAPIRDSDGVIVGVVLVFSDVSEDYRLRSALAKASSLLARTEELAKVGGWEFDLQTMQFSWSAETFRIHEMDVGLPPTMEQSFASFTEESRPVIQAAVNAAIEHGTPYDLELSKFTSKGRLIWVRAQGSGVFENGKIIKLFGALHDITERKRAEQYDQFRNAVLELLAGTESLPAILKFLVLGVEALDREMLCSVLLLDSDGKHLVKGVAPSLPEFYNAALEGSEIGLGRGSCGTSAYTGERVIVEDIHTHPYWVQYRALAAQASLGACWSQPIRSSTGKILGTFAIYYRNTHSPTTHDIVIIEQCARLASIAIEKNIAAEKLRDSEAHYRLLAEEAYDVVWRTDASSRFTYVSPADERIRGYKADEVIGRHVYELLTDDGKAALKKKLSDELVASKDEKKSKTINIELQQFCKDGTKIWTDVHFTPTLDASGNINGYQGITRDITSRRLTEEALRIAAIAFESQEGMYITDTDWVFLRVNKAFTEITGFSTSDVIGQKPDLLRSGAHDASFYQEMIARLESNGSWQGEIWDKRKNGDVFPALLTVTVVKDENEKITHYVGTFTDISSRKSAEEKIRSLAFYDPLTHLPNRRLLMDRLEQALLGAGRHKRKGALLFVDLDNFKTLNDTLGHDKGDILLQEVAKRLLTCTREGDTVARLGGDEFVIMLEDLSEDNMEAAQQAEAAGEKILDALNQGYQLAGIEHRSTPSIGITLFGEKQETIDEPLKRADLAMYQAKAAGRNSLRFFDPQMQEVVAAHVAMEEGLREAMSKGQFILHYQVQVQGAGEWIGAEALVRWIHPQRGMVQPLEFIPFAEETGLILPLGNWVLTSACEQLAIWANDPLMAHLTLAVNVSPRQFHQDDFVDQVLSILKNTGANPYRLKLELTESMLVSNVEDVIEKMYAIKRHGVGFSLDDFGTGFSSLSYLKRLPLDQLKIDQGFVRDILIDPNDAAIAKMVIVLAESLGLTVIAEGVETIAHRDYLASQGCHTYQGYLYSRPLPLTDFEEFVKKPDRR